MMQRRAFLAGLVGAFAAPAIVRADNLMKLWVPPPPVTLADHVGDGLRYTPKLRDLVLHVNSHRHDAAFKTVADALKVATKGSTIMVTPGHVERVPEGGIIAPAGVNLDITGAYFYKDKATLTPEPFDCLVEHVRVRTR